MVHIWFKNSRAKARGESIPGAGVMPDPDPAEDTSGKTGHQQMDFRSDVPKEQIIREIESIDNEGDDNGTKRSNRDNRSSITKNQSEILKAYYNFNRHPRRDEIDQISEQIGTYVHEIFVFQNFLKHFEKSFHQAFSYFWRNFNIQIH